MVLQYQDQTSYYSPRIQKKPVIWFIRHGESEANIGLAMKYAREARLTMAGKWQAKEVAKTFIHSPELIISSPYMRAQETSRPTQLRFPNARFETRPVHEFTYLGSLHGTCSTKQDRCALANAFWKKSDPTYTDGDGESFEAFIYRARTEIERLMQGEEKFIAIFSHEQFIRAAYGLLNGWTANTSTSMKLFRQLLNSEPLPNGYILEWKAREY